MLHETTPTVDGSALPLSSWSFAGELRHSQRDILQTVHPVPGDPVHVVAPPGAGKTLLGLLLAADVGHRAVVLAPTTAIRHQWARTARDLAGRADAVSEDPDQVADLTALTYQALSVVGSADALSHVARTAWHDELVASGRTGRVADEFLDDLRRRNARSYRAGIRRRARRLRREIVRADPVAVEQVLHPSALALIDRLVAADVRTIVLDECHHLLDHWALVIGYLQSRLRAAGVEPTVIGLTATLPSPDDGRGHDVYTALLGEVDYEVPVPAVVREGNLAPYRDLVWVVEPADDEVAFLTDHERRLEEFVTDVLDTSEGVAFFADVLQPPGTDTASEDDRLALAFDEDALFAQSAGRFLTRFEPRHPLVRHLPPAARQDPDVEDTLVAVSRFALRRLLTDADRRAEWESARRTLADFGYQLTDRGVRRGRDPVAAVLAHSRAKDSGAVEILHHELRGTDGPRVRAVVVCDYAVHGNQHGRDDAEAAGALRTFGTLVADPTVATLRPVLLTAQYVRVATQHAETVAEALTDLLDVAPSSTPLPEDPRVSVLDVGSTPPGAMVAAVSQLVSDGVVRLLVGTRGLLGEGWDCPAVNTLVDLTAVSTASATQQLRGRTLRLDPAWPHKVAHNWGVVCLPKSSSRLSASSELRRLRRRHQQLWGLSTDDDVAIVRGTTHSLTTEQLQGMMLRTGGRSTVPIAEINAETLRRLPARAQTYAQWRVGTDYLGVEREKVRVTTGGKRPTLLTAPTAVVAYTMLAVLGLAIGRTVASMLLRLAPASGSWAAGIVVTATALAIALGGWRLARDAWRTIRHRARPALTYRDATLAVVDALRAAGRAPAFTAANVEVTPLLTADRSSRNRPLGYEMSLTGGTNVEQRVVIGAVAELFGPVGRTRFLLHVGVRRDGGPVERLVDRISPPSPYLMVPSVLARRRADAQRFAAAWDRRVGRCTLVEVTGRDALGALALARRRSASAYQESTRTAAWY